MNSKLKGISIEEMRSEIRRRLSAKPELVKYLDWFPVVDYVNKNIINHPSKDSISMGF